MLHSDDVETVNPLGSSNSNQKLKMVNMILRNLPPRLNSSFPNIPIVALGHASGVKKYVYHIFLAPVVNELKSLEKQIPLVTESKVQTVKAVLVDFAGDNLGWHQVFRYLQSLCVNKFCEWCSADQE
jgi:hypothetical protein